MQLSKKTLAESKLIVLIYGGFYYYIRIVFFLENITLIKCLSKFKYIRDKEGMMSTYIFPGQGSQTKGMGGNLFNQFPNIALQADQVLGYSIKTLCLEDPDQLLNQTKYTQPALYTVNALTYFKKIQDSEKKPDYVAGHSLGEYNALLAAGVFDFITGLQLVKKRGEIMSLASGGAMAAVIGLNANAIKTALAQASIHNVVIANYNSHTQLVISGPQEELNRAQAACDKAGASMVIPLKVSGAFHSPCMQEAQIQFEEFVKNFQFSPPNISVIANSTALPYLSKNIHQTLSQQITSPVKWTESIEYLFTLGETQIEEIGPGTVLTGLVRRIKNGQ